MASWELELEDVRARAEEAMRKLDFGDALMLLVRAQALAGNADTRTQHGVLDDIERVTSTARVFDLLEGIAYDAKLTDSLRPEGNDDADFFEVSKLSLLDALRAAYFAGRDSRR